MVKIRSWVPNLFTMGNLSLGFTSILLTSQANGDPGRLTLSGGLILLAVLCDGLDGFAARLLNARSELGAQLDSLADLTAFGIAPGVLMYSLVLKQYTIQITPHTSIPFGMFLAAIFPICAAYRLARFNVQHDADGFRGLPAPVAGIIVGLMPLVFTGRLELPSILLTSIFIFAAFLMVSTIKYAKPQITGLSRFSPMRLALIFLFIISALIFLWLKYNYEYAFVGLFFIITVYVMSGLASLLIQLIQKYRM